MPPEGRLEDKPRARNPESETRSDNLSPARTSNLLKAEMERMRPSTTSGTSPLSLESSSTATRSNNRAIADRPDNGSSPERTRSQPGADSPTKRQAFSNASNYNDFSRQYYAPYGNGNILVEQRWQYNVGPDKRYDGTISGVSSYTANGKQVQLHWLQERNGQITPKYAVETYRNEKGLVHDYFNYTQDAQGRTTIDYNGDRGQIVVHKDSNGIKTGGYLRTPGESNGKSNLVSFDKDNNVLAEQQIEATTAHDTATIAKLETLSTQAVSGIKPEKPKEPGASVPAKGEPPAPPKEKAPGAAGETPKPAEPAKPVEPSKPDEPAKSSTDKSKSTAPEYDGSQTYSNAIDHWKTNPDGSKTGFTRFNPDPNFGGDVIELHWDRDKSNRSTPRFAERISTLPNGDTVHKRMGFGYSREGAPVLDEKVTETKTVHRDGSYDTSKPGVNGSNDIASYDKDGKLLSKKSSEKLADGSTKETTVNADGSQTQRRSLGTRTIITDLDASGQMIRTSIAGSDNKPISTLTYDKDKKSVTFSSLSPDYPNGQMSKTWTYTGKDDKGNQAWAEGGDPSKTVYNLKFDLDDNQWHFNDASGASFPGNFSRVASGSERPANTAGSNGAVADVDKPSEPSKYKASEDRSAEAIDAKYKREMTQAEYDRKRDDLEKQLEKQGVLINKEATVQSYLEGQGYRSVETVRPTLAQLEAVKAAIDRFRPDGLPKPKDNVTFTFLKENDSHINARYMGNNHILVYPQASKDQESLQAYNTVAHRAQGGRAGESLEATLSHEYVHLIEDPILDNGATAGPYINRYGLERFADSTNGNQITTAIRGKQTELCTDGQQHNILWKAVQENSGNLYRCSVAMNPEGKPVVAIKSEGLDTYNVYERRHANGDPYPDANGRPVRIDSWRMMDQAAITPASSYLTGNHATTEARTDFALGGLSREHLFKKSRTMYAEAKKDDQAYIAANYGNNYIRNWNGQIVPRTKAVLDEIAKKETYNR